MQTEPQSRTVAQIKLVLNLIAICPVLATAHGTLGLPLHKGGRIVSKPADGGSGEGEDSITVEAGRYCDVEMDCATVADGKLDERIELPDKQIKMSGKLSKVRTEPFRRFSQCDEACQGLGFMSSNSIDP